MHRGRISFCLVLAVLSIAHPLSGQSSKRSLDPTAIDSDEKQRNPSNMASTYVPLDSWVYPAFDRLAALGYVQTDFVALRPWTRMECARLVQEAGDRAADEESDAGAAVLYRNLAAEFALELRREDGAANSGMQIESIYNQVVDIAGRPLTDGFHSAQTINNNFGRPYGEGVNSYTGAALRAQAGWFAFYLRGEYQQSGGVPALSPAAQSAIAHADFTPAAAEGPASNVSRFRLLDTYVSVAFKNNQISVGKQSLWWGPNFGGPMLYSDNAEPITMLRYDRVSPFKLPGFLGWLGPMRVQFFVGQLSGYQFMNIPTPGQPGFTHIVGQPGISLSPQPYIHGEKVTLNPTPNLELSVARTVIFGGPGFPATLGHFWNSLVSVAPGNGGPNDPGDRRASFDFKYRIPGIRDWLTLYSDSFTNDEVFPLAYPTHSGWSPGVYLAKLPYFHKVDFRAEGAFTPTRLFPGFFYFDVNWLSGYTNNRELLGSWVGRQGSGYQLWSTCWFSARTTVQANYRSMWVDHSFLQGGSLKDLGLVTNVALSAEFSLQVSAQYERWHFPLLTAGTVSNMTTSFQISYSPKWGTR